MSASTAGIIPAVKDINRAKSNNTFLPVAILIKKDGGGMCPITI
jgi:hypothetical protein